MKRLTITISRKNIITMLSVLMLLFSLVHMTWLLVLVGLLAFIGVIDEVAKREVRSSFESYYTVKWTNIKNLGMFGIMFIVAFTLFQCFALKLSLPETMQCICINFAIFFFLIIANGFINVLHVKDVFYRSICWFNVIFSTYYLYRVFRFGLPEDRDSVLGYVSSNFCAAVLYFGYPIILYYLSKNKRESKKLPYLALSESLIVILISGSRTALGVVFLLVALILVFNQDSFYSRVKTIATLLVGILMVVLAYRRITAIRELVDRALLILQGRETLISDIRTVAWGYALDNFKSYNHVLGSGSNIVPQLVRPAHNFLIEILLTDGYLGIVAFVILILFFLVRGLKGTSYKQKFFIVQIILITIIVAYVQPFFSTSYTLGIIASASVLAISFDETEEPQRCLE